MTKSVLYNLYADLTNSMKNVIAAKYVFLQDRPTVKEGETPMSKFAVIDLPVSIEDYVVGNKKSLLNTSGVFYLFAQARSNGTLDVNALGDFVDDVIKLFPINGICCSAANPIVRMTGSDGHGFQVATITFDLQTKWKVFD